MAAKTVDGIAFSGKNLIGLKFNRLTVLRLAGKKDMRDPNRPAKAIWECRCECGKLTAVLGEQIRGGYTQSCGCLKTERMIEYFTKHGLSAGKKHILYSKWTGMISRTENPKGDFWKDYGGRGIKMCKRWRNDCGEFAKDMLPTWVSGLMIERINNDGHYSCGKCEDCIGNGWPMNCRWATMKEQARNRRSNRIVEVNGVSHPLFYWQEHYGYNLGRFYQRVRRGWSESDALSIQGDCRYKMTKEVLR